MGSNEVATKTDILKDASGKLELLIESNLKAFPKSFNKTRFIQNCITVMRETKNIEDCTPISIARCMIKGAFLDLDFFRRECYAIAYKIKDTNPPKYELNFQTDYKGEIKLCTMYGARQILDVDAKLVREGDVLDLGIKDGKPVCNLTPKPFNDGPIIGAIAYVYYKDGGFAYDAMSKAEIESTRQKYSKIPDGPAWQKSPGEMYKKVVLRRLTKKVALNFDNADQDEAYIDGAGVVLDAEVLPAPKDQVIDPFAKKAEVQPPAPAISAADQIILDKLKKAYPNEEAWQIEARFKEIKEAGAGK